MPIFGQLEIADHLDRAATVSRLMSEADEFTVENVDILVFTAEIAIDQGFKVTPKALHPSLPSYAQVVFRRHPDSPCGPFTLAELRINTRAGTNYVGYCVGGFTDNARAAEFFATRYGMPLQVAEVSLKRAYFGLLGTVHVEGDAVFDGRLEKPHYISGSDVLYTPNLNLARVDGEPRLVHQELEFTIGKAERGAPVITTFDARAFGDDRVILRNHLPATMTNAKVTYTAVRYLMDPNQPAMAGTRDLSAA